MTVTSFPNIKISDNISLFCGDCLEVMQDIPDHSIDLIVADLPYGISRNQWDALLPLDRLWDAYQRIIKENGAILLFGQGMFTTKLMTSNPKMWRYNLIWHKTEPVGFLNANRMPLRAHEDICVFYRKLPTYNPQKTSGHARKSSTAQHKRNCKQSSNYGQYALSSYDSTERFPTSVLTFASDKQKAALHPTQKPVALLEWLIRTYSNPGELVLDNTMGSGSTGVACLHTNRRFIGIEQDATYFETAKTRLLNEGERSSPTQ